MGKNTSLLKAALVQTKLQWEQRSDVADGTDTHTFWLLMVQIPSSSCCFWLNGSHKSDTWLTATNTLIASIYCGFAFFNPLYLWFNSQEEIQRRTVTCQFGISLFSVCFFKWLRHNSATVKMLLYPSFTDRFGSQPAGACVLDIFIRKLWFLMTRGLQTTGAEKTFPLGVGGNQAPSDNSGTSNCVELF